MPIQDAVADTFGQHFKNEALIDVDPATFETFLHPSMHAQKSYISVLPWLLLVLQRCFTEKSSTLAAKTCDLTRDGTLVPTTFPLLTHPNVVMQLDPKQTPNSKDVGTC